MVEDDFLDEEDSDFVPLILQENDNPTTIRAKSDMKRASLEIMPTSSPSTIKPAHGRCILVVICLSAVSFGGALVRLGLSRATFHAEETTKLETCKERFNISVDDLLGRLARPEEWSYCMPQHTKCACMNPLIPAKRDDRGEDFFERWNKTHYRNIASVNAMSENPYDVVFFGDSITEHWSGTDLGHPYKQLADGQRVFNKYFHIDDGGGVNGLALGIGGDRCPQLLYRLQDGELPSSLQSKVFWVLIGTNDFGGDSCTAEVIAAGNIRIAKELRGRKPTSKIVLNSILPRGKPGSDLLEDEIAWPLLTTVNRWLECYANENEKVEFFNATDIFLRPNETIAWNSYFSDPVHPSAEGYSAWADAIAAWLLNALKT